TLWAWGSNGHGQIGIDSTGGIFTPVELTGPCELANGIEEGTDARSISVYPNPATGLFRIELTGSPEAVPLVISSAIGQDVLRSTLNGTSSMIDLSSQPSGVYFLTIRSQGSIMTRTLFKQ
ncbi:MAG TPA: T9SS type A sorting domain-containing protein, partial [Flavobacteriales bacterium]|nr:T9SS type A sorting domain-containing protein [Flavobacteriales bacterium]